MYATKPRPLPKGGVGEGLSIFLLPQGEVSLREKLRCCLYTLGF